MKRGTKTYRERIAELLILFCLFFLIASCKSKKDTYKVKIVNGVRVVENYQPTWGNDPKIELKFGRKIGGLDTRDENYTCLDHI
jgi:hypothetical protein